MKKVHSYIGIPFIGVILSIFLSPGVWTWTVFFGDYFLGNPSPFFEYSDKLMRDYARTWPLKSNYTIAPTPFPELHMETYDVEALRILTNDWKAPAVIRGVFSNWSQEARAMWTPEYFIKHFGDRKFAAFLNNRMGEDEHYVEARYITVEEAVENITRGGNNYMFNCMMSPPDDLELYYSQNLLHKLGISYPPALFQFFLGKSRIGEQRLSGSPLHAAVGTNLFTQISGTKKWILIDPKYSIYLRPRLVNQQYACVSRYEREYGTAQRFQNFPRFETLLNPGDVLFLPPWWYHEVQNIPSHDWIMGSATRVVIPASLATNKLFTFMTTFGTVTHGSMTPKIFRPIVNRLWYASGRSWLNSTHMNVTGLAVDTAKMMDGARRIEMDFE